MANNVGVVNSLEKWTFQNAHVERQLDDAAYTAAHPDDTLILAGPARSGLADIGAAYPEPDSATPVAADKVPLLPIGMLQRISWSQEKPTRPMMAIGSGRTFFTSGKAMTSWNAARLWVNGRNFLNVLYANAQALKINVANFDDPAAEAEGSKFFTNLDSELYYMPFGMACVFRNKAHDWLGSFYVEMCMINSWNASLRAGDSNILEEVSGIADRMLPFDLSSTASSPGVPRATVDKIIGFTDGTYSDTTSSTIAETVPR